MPLEFVARASTPRRPARRRAALPARPASTSRRCARFPYDINEIHRLAGARTRARSRSTGSERQALNDAVEQLVARGRRPAASCRSVDPRLAALTVLSNDEGVQNWYRPVDGRRLARPRRRRLRGRRDRRRSSPTSPLRGLLARAPATSTAIRSATPTARLDVTIAVRGRQSGPPYFDGQLDRDRGLPYVSPHGLDVPSPDPCAPRRRLRRPRLPRSCSRPSPSPPGGADGGDDDRRPSGSSSGSRQQRATRRRDHPRLQRLARLVPAGRSPRRRASSSEVGVDVEAQVLRRLHRLARRPGRRRARRQQPDAQRHDASGSSGGSEQVDRRRSTTTRPATTPIIVDESITSIEDLAGQDGRRRGRAWSTTSCCCRASTTEGMTEDDIDFRGVPPTPRRPASPAASSTPSACSPRSRSRRSSGRARKVLFGSADFPGTIPDHLVLDRRAGRRAPRRRPEARRRLVRHARLDRGATPTRPTRSWPSRPAVGRGVRGLRRRHADLHARPGARQPSRARDDVDLAARTRPSRSTRSCVESGLDPGGGRRSTGSSTRRSPRPTSTPGGDGDRDPGDRGDGGAAATGPPEATTAPVATARPRRRRRPCGAGRGADRSAPSRRIRGTLPLRWRLALGVAGMAGLGVLWLVAAPDRRGVDGRRVPTPAATWDALAELWRTATLLADLGASGAAHPDRLRDQHGDRHRGRRGAWALPLGRGVRRRRRSASCATSRPPRSSRCSCFWLGIDETPKITLIVVGTVFFNILMIADVARAVPRELINAAYTLGAGRADGARAG